MACSPTNSTDNRWNSAVSTQKKSVRGIVNLVGLPGGWDDRRIDLGREGLGLWPPLCRLIGVPVSGGDYQPLRMALLVGFKNFVTAVELVVRVVLAAR